ncbi:MAG TPA: VOC family protein [Alphaproteobacteria bacterium]|nr:VOC family protein [Alphaproteobacteria bacterium]
MTTKLEPRIEAQTPCGLNHLVLNVRDIEESHRFWTELLGFRQTGASHRLASDGKPPARFYSGERDGKLHHHDIALVEASVPAAGSSAQPQALNHVAIEYPDKETWEKQIDFLIARGVALHRRVERGVTHSIHLTDPNGNEIELVCELPRALWENDIDAGLNRYVEQPISE